LRRIEPKLVTRRGRGRPHDQVWCVFDRDEHPNFAKAIDLADRHGINLAISNPCLELWVILHFEDQTAYLERQTAQDRAEEHKARRKARGIRLTTGQQPQQWCIESHRPYPQCLTR
jgi:hypothetical protein